MGIYHHHEDDGWLACLGNVRSFHKDRSPVVCQRTILIHRSSGYGAVPQHVSAQKTFKLARHSYNATSRVRTLDVRMVLIIRLSIR